MKIIFFLLAIFAVFKVNAQTYLINFVGSGGSTTVSTVKVENLTQETSLTLNGSDILQLTLLTGINSPEDNRSFGFNIYPNPMSDYSTFEIFAPVAGDAVISICDISGKPVAQIREYLENLRQDFRISGLNKGLYFIYVQGKNYKFSGRLISNLKYNGALTIEKVSGNVQAIDKKISEIDSKGVEATVPMDYTTGDRLKFTGISGIYNTIITDIPAGNKTITFNFSACTDGDGNNYPVVVIGTQIWMAENLKTTKYKDGTTSIPNVTGSAAWSALSTPGFCWYNNDEATYKAVYGALYNWYTVGTGNLCPTGWHMPADADWTALITLSGGDAVAGDKLKETGSAHWNSPPNTSNNESGFTALPGGYRADYNIFDYVGRYGYWWSATQFDALTVWSRTLYSNSGLVSKIGNDKKNGFSVRCLRD
jgi:uncharacterized protein (TIGR02145 family)